MQHTDFGIRSPQGQIWSCDSRETAEATVTDAPHMEVVCRTPGGTWEPAAAATLSAAANKLHAAAQDPEALAALMTKDVAIALVEILNARAYLARVGGPEREVDAATDYEALRLAAHILDQPDRSRP